MYKDYNIQTRQPTLDPRTKTFCVIFKKAVAKKSFKKKFKQKNFEKKIPQKSF